MQSQETADVVEAMLDEVDDDAIDDDSYMKVCTCLYTHIYVSKHICICILVHVCIYI
jgi:hypothetical protein